MTSTKSTVCIVIPTLNEAKNISTLIEQIFEQQHALPTYDLHILLVDGDSQDDTLAVVSTLQKIYPKLDFIICKERGLGIAYKAGFKHIIKTLNPDFIFEMDADGQHDPKMIPIFLKLTENGHDCIIGSRFVSGGKLINFSFKRKLLSKIGNFLIRVIGGIPNIADCTSGYRCIRTSYIKKCQFKYLLTTGYAFQSSLISELVRNNASIVEYPIVFNERLHGESKLRFKDQLDFLINLFFIRINKSFLFIKYVTVGVLGIGVNMGSYYVLTRHLMLANDPAVLVAIELSVIHNFIGHHLWTFNNKSIVSEPLYLHFFKYHLSVLISAFVHYSVFFICLRAFFFWDIFANLIGIFAAFLINYVINTQFTWKTNTQSSLT